MLPALQDGADLPDLAPIERAEPKAATHVGLEDAIAGEAEQGLADGSPADAELGGQCRVADSEAGAQLASVDAIEEVAVDLVAEWGPGDGSGGDVFRIHIQYTVFCFPARRLEAPCSD